MHKNCHKRVNEVISIARLPLMGLPRFSMEIRKLAKLGVGAYSSMCAPLVFYGRCNNIDIYRCNNKKCRSHFRSRSTETSFPSSTNQLMWQRAAVGCLMCSLCSEWKIKNSYTCTYRLHSSSSPESLVSQYLAYKQLLVVATRFSWHVNIAISEFGCNVQGHERRAMT